MQSVRIVFLTSRYWPATGGVETYMHHVARALAERHDVTVLAFTIDEALPGRLGVSLQPAPSFEPFKDGRVDVAPVRLEARHRRRLWPMLLQVAPGSARYAFGKMRRPLGAYYGRVVGPLVAQLAAGADVLHVWSADMVGAAGLRAARRIRRPIVITPFVHPGQWGTDPASVRVYRSADRVIALLNAERSVFAELGVPTDRVAVCGVCSPGVSAGGGEELRVRYDLRGPVVLFLGARRPYKGHELLLKAARRVAEVHPDATFAFVGPGDAINATDGAPLRIIDAGLVDDQERGAWLEAADLLCLPSAHEIFPLSILEAWSVGTPVLVTDLPPLREVIGRGGGELLPARSAEAIGEALVRLLADPRRLGARGEAGRSFWAAHGTPAAAAARHEVLYEEVLVGA